ncbi:hypothetical protein VDTJJZMW_CDS_0192 [Pseudomonas phage LPS-5]
MLPLTELICMSKRNWIEPRHVLGRLNSVWRALGRLYPSLAESICMGCSPDTHTQIPTTDNPSINP